MAYCVTSSANGATFHRGRERADAERVGVFVNIPAGRMIDMAQEATLDSVQMHGAESVADILAVQQAGLHVVKALRATGAELVAAALALPPQTEILVECSTGPMPGGTGNAWNWGAAAALAAYRPFALAGGLTAANLVNAAGASRAVGFDASSSLESAPGVKDVAAIRAFLEAVARLPATPTAFAWKGNS